MKEQLVRWYTPHLSRDFEMLTFGEAGYPVIAFPTSLGRYYQLRDFKLTESVAHLVDAGRVKLYCPDGIDERSWYNKALAPTDRVRTHMAYESVILNDVVTRAQQETGHARVAVAGASFGAYHAMNFALRHPDRVGYCLCMGGSYDIRSATSTIPSIICPTSTTRGSSVTCATWASSSARATATAAATAITNFPACSPPRACLISSTTANGAVTIGVTGGKCFRTTFPGHK